MRSPLLVQFVQFWVNLFIRFIFILLLASTARGAGPRGPGGRAAFFEQLSKGACLVLGPNYYCPYHYYINRVIRMLSSSLFNYV